MQLKLLLPHHILAFVLLLYFPVKILTWVTWHTTWHTTWHITWYITTHHMTYYMIHHMTHHMTHHSTSGKIWTRVTWHITWYITWYVTWSVKSKTCVKLKILIPEIWKEKLVISLILKIKELNYSDLTSES